MFWQEKSKVKWHNEGDKHTAFFHSISKIINCTKLISTIEHEEEVFTDPKDISSIFSNHYEQIFNSSHVYVDNDLVDEVIPNLVNGHTNALLTTHPSQDEIQSAVFSMNKDGSPRPDGFGGYFVQHYWEIIKTDVINEMVQFFSTCWVVPNWNANSTVLVPKCSNDIIVDQHRPIALANFKFKILSKIMADSR
ncbi:hypothetical protein KIW84_032149 [Lathyrus oleraceus]|uniref:RNA-directed DNA polymerase (Reverse transcriptase) n=1 Tax=Pisum sativum TaxID=3888 RepID=A0A9D5AW89_PEA|nr:hypothetical protein KIW84_032149 [Pisum sativum]